MTQSHWSTTCKKNEDWIKYGDLTYFLYYQPIVFAKTYNLINRTGKFHESIKSWNCLPSLKITWNNFKVHFCKAHLKITKAGELNLEEAGYGQANLVEKIVSRINAELNHQYNMCEHIPDEYTAPPHATVGNTTNNTILQQVIAHNQDLMRQLSISKSSTRNHKSNLPRPSTGPHQGKPCTPMLSCGTVTMDST